MKREHWQILLVMIGLVIVRGLLYSLLVPFDQTPDESFHFRLIKAKQVQISGHSAAETLNVAARTEAAIRQLLYPAAAPERWTPEQFRGSKLPAPPPSHDLYYLTTAWLLKSFSSEHIRDDVFAVRGFSLLCTAAIVAMAFLIGRELFPHDRFLLIGIPTLIIFIPQFMAMSGVINNDKLAEVFTTVIFFILVKILKNRFSPGYAAAFMLCFGLAWFSKRTTRFLLPLLLIFIFLYLWKGAMNLRMWGTLLALCLSVGLLAYALMEIPAVYNFFDEHVLDLPSGHFLKENLFHPDLKYYAKFFIVMYWSFWAVFGYMTIHVHHLWYVGCALVQGLSIIGLGRFVWSAKRPARRFDVWQSKVLLLFALSILLTVLVAFARSVLLRAGDPFLDQGRRLFPVIAPISVLTLFGLANLFSFKHLRFIGAACLLGLILLDIVCLSNYILLNFHLRSLF